MKPGTQRAGPLARLFAHYSAYHEHGQLQRYMALMGIIAFPALYLMRFVRSAPGYDDLPLRALDTLLCVLLLLRSQWPERLKPWYMAYSYLVLVVTLPLTFVFTSLMNGGGPAAVGNTFFAVFLLMLLADWRNLIVMLVVGFAMGTGLYFAVSPHPSIPMEYVARLPVLVVGVIGGSLFKHALERASGERVRQAYASLAGSIAHEMRNPLAQVRHSLEQIREALPMPSLRLQDQVIDAGSVERLYRHVSQGETAVRRGLQVIDMTLDEVNARGIDPSRLVHVWAGDLCTKAVDEFGYEDAGQRARVRVDVRRDFAFRGDETAFLFVLFNLLKNALHYLPVQPDMAVRVEVDAGRVTVRDTGPGIAADILPDLFQPFRTSGKASGTGLGLAYCQRVIRAFGGEISCQSEPGSTAFTMALPVIAGDEVAAGREQALAQARRVLADKRVLVVDDDAALRVYTRQHLLSLCCTVREAADGLEALQALRDTPFDLVLLDLNMPRMDGYEVAESVRRGLVPLNTGVCLVAHTAEPVHLARVKTHKAGFDGFVTKPADALVFMQALQAALAQRSRAAQQPPGWLRGRCILVADDNAYNRMALAAYLRHAGAQVVEAADGQAALERLAQAPDIDAVLLDMEMPRLGGLEAARAIRAGAAGERHIPILAVTGYAGPEVLAACGAAGIAACIVKPVDQAMLYRRLAEVLGLQGAQEVPAAPVHEADLLDEDRLRNFLRLGMLHELVDEFVPRVQVLVASIEQARAAGDLRATLDALHSLVGMSGEAGARALYLYGRDIYVGMRETGQWPPQAQWTDRLLELTQASNLALTQWAAGHGARAVG